MMGGDCCCAVPVCFGPCADRRFVDPSVVGGLVVVSSGGAPTPAGTSVFTKHNWDMGMGYLWLNGWGIYHLMGGAFMAYWLDIYDLMEGHLYHLMGGAFIT